MHTEPFDFDTRIERNSDASAKWARRTDAEKAADVMPLSVADMEFATAPAVVRAVQAAATHGIYGYTDSDERYRSAVCGWMEHRHGYTIDPEWIVPENGVVPAVCVAVRVFTNPGDPVLVHTPCYSPFVMAIESNGRKPLYSALIEGADGLYRMDMDDLRQKTASPDVKLLILCSPHNPTGRIWTREELQEVARICRDNDVIILSDEIHCDLALYGKHLPFPLAAPDMAAQTILCTAPSKTFNLAGLQLANTIIPDPTLRKTFTARMNADGYGNVSYFGYHATVAAYTQGEPWLEALLDYVRENFTILSQWLRQNAPAVRLTPIQGTYLAWTNWRALGLPEASLLKIVREEAMIIPNPGTFFGEEAEGFLRFNLAIPRHELTKALSRLQTALQSHPELEPSLKE